MCVLAVWRSSQLVTTTKYVLTYVCCDTLQRMHSCTHVYLHSWLLGVVALKENEGYTLLFFCCVCFSVYFSSVQWALAQRGAATWAEDVPSVPECCHPCGVGAGEGQRQGPGTADSSTLCASIHRLQSTIPVLVYECTYVRTYVSNSNLLRDQVNALCPIMTVKPTLQTSVHIFLSGDEWREWRTHLSRSHTWVWHQLLCTYIPVHTYVCTGMYIYLLWFVSSVILCSNEVVMEIFVPLPLYHVVWRTQTHSIAFPPCLPWFYIWLTARDKLCCTGSNIASDITCCLQYKYQWPQPPFQLQLSFSHCGWLEALKVIWSQLKIRSTNVCIPSLSFV